MWMITHEPRNGNESCISVPLSRKNMGVPIIIPIFIFFIVILSIAYGWIPSNNHTERDNLNAIINVNPVYGIVGETVLFSSENSKGSIANLQWDFGDGSVSSESNPAHIFQYGGRYNIILTVSDENNRLDKCNITYNVQPSSYSVDFEHEGIVWIRDGKTGPRFAGDLGPSARRPNINITLDVKKATGDFYLEMWIYFEDDVIPIYSRNISSYREDINISVAISQTDLPSTCEEEFCHLEIGFSVDQGKTGQIHLYLKVEYPEA